MERVQAKAPAAPAGRQGKYLVFELGREEFGVAVVKVREIMGLLEVTKVPGTPHYVRGVINLRGKVVPVIDLRRKFSMEETPQTARTCVVVLQVALERDGREESLLMGVIVDGVAEVVTIREQEIEDTPSFGAEIEMPYIVGMAKVKGRVKILLDIDRVMSAQELSGIGKLPQLQGDAAAAQ